MELKTLISYLEENKELELTLVEGEIWDIDTPTQKLYSELETELETLFSHKDFLPVGSEEVGRTDTTLSLQDNKFLVRQQEVLYNNGEGDLQGETSVLTLPLT